MTVRLFALLLACVLLPSPLPAAIHPMAIVEQATHRLLLRERTRIVQERTLGESRLRRVRLVAEVLAVRRGEDVKPGDVVTIDYTVDLTARERAARAHAARGPMPGPQFIGEPDAPALDEQGRFWAAIAPAPNAAAAGLRRNGAADAADAGDREQASGVVYVPAAGQYSWMAEFVGR